MKFSLPKNFGQITEAFHKKAQTHVLNPYRDWALMLLVFLIALAGLVAWSLYLFSGISNGDLFSGTGDTLPRSQTVDRTKLDQTLKDFADREVKTEMLKKAPPVVADPSL